MKAVICDGCGTQAKQADAYGSAPFGWLTVHVRREQYEGPKDYCSKTCAMQALESAPVVDAAAAEPTGDRLSFAHTGASLV